MRRSSHSPSDLLCLCFRTLLHMWAPRLPLRQRCDVSAQNSHDGPLKRNVLPFPPSDILSVTAMESSDGSFEPLDSPLCFSCSEQLRIVVDLLDCVSNPHRRATGRMWRMELPAHSTLFSCSVLKHLFLVVLGFFATRLMFVCRLFFSL